MINKRKISLTPEIGDWTLFQPELDNDITIGNVGISDFDRLSREQMELAHRLHYQASEQLSGHLRNEMKVKLDLFYVEALQLAYGDFNQMISEDDMVHVIISLGGSYEVSLYIYRKLANALLERSFGGRCVASEGHLSELEEKAFEVVAGEVIKPILDLCEINIKDVLIKDVSDMVVENLVLSKQSTYNCYISKISVANNEPGLIKYCYDRDTLLMLLSRYEIVRKKQTGKVSLNSNTQSNIDLSVGVELGSAMISMKDLKNLTEGDVIALDRSLSQPLVGSIADKVKFIGYPGLINDNIAIQIAEVDYNSKSKLTGVVSFDIPSVSSGNFAANNFAVESIQDTGKSTDLLEEENFVEEESLTEEEMVPDAISTEEEITDIVEETDVFKEDVLDDVKPDTEDIFVDDSADLSGVDIYDQVLGEEELPPVESETEPLETEQNDSEEAKEDIFGDDDDFSWDEE